MSYFKDKVIYQIYPKSFYDTNGDGVGDIKGVTDKLDYLKKLGIDYIWLTPFFVSPQNDNGYDVADYYNIDPSYGVMDDVEELIREADKRGIGLMFDMVFNHTSTEHEWFKKAMSGDERYQNYYIFREGESDKAPTNWLSKFGGSAWEYVPNLRKWYLHLFDKTQADLNWDNKEVRDELKKVILYWKAKGIKGFRFDVVNLISKPELFESDMEGDGRRFYTDGPHVHEYIKEIISDTNISDMVTVGEMSSTSLDECIRYTNPDECELSMVFSFHHLKVDYNNGDKWSLKELDYNDLKNIFYVWQLGMQKGHGWNALFWCNHDQPRALSRFGNDKEYHDESAKMLATMIHMMKGTPYIYQGEEIGMTNHGYTSIEQYRDVESLNYYKILTEKGFSSEEALEVLRQRSRDNNRTPMQWNDSENAGFTSGRPWIMCPENYHVINVENQIADSSSIWNYYRELIKIRKNHKAISEGEISFFTDVPEAVFAYRRTHCKENIVVLVNLKENVISIRMNGLKVYKKRIIGNYTDVLVVGDEITLRAYEAVVLSDCLQIM